LFLLSVLINSSLFVDEHIPKVDVDKDTDDKFVLKLTSREIITLFVSESYNR
jgi:hypothetical protein